MSRCDSADGPLIVEQGLYTRQQVMRLLNVSSDTLGQWKADGLRACRRGTKQTYYAGRDLIQFLRGGDDGQDAEE